MIYEYLANKDIYTLIQEFTTYFVLWKYSMVALIVYYCVTKIRDVYLLQLIFI